MIKIFAKCTNAKCKNEKELTQLEIATAKSMGTAFCDKCYSIMLVKKVIK